MAAVTYVAARETRWQSLLEIVAGGPLLEKRHRTPQIHGLVPANFRAQLAAISNRSEDLPMICPALFLGQVLSQLSRRPGFSSLRGR